MPAYAGPNRLPNIVLLKERWENLTAIIMLDKKCGLTRGIAEKVSRQRDILEQYISDHTNVIQFKEYKKSLEAPAPDSMLFKIKNNSCGQDDIMRAVWFLNQCLVENPKTFEPEDIYDLLKE